MKRIVLLSLLTLILVNPGYAREYQSPFGFTVNLSSDWLVLSKQELKDNPDLFDLSGQRFPGVNKDLIEQIRGAIQSGRVEVYLNQATSDPSFLDNINVSKGIGKIPTNKEELSELCNALPIEVSRAFGRKINLYRCEFREVNKLNSLYLDFDGLVEETRSLQYQIQKSPSIQILITATCKNRSLETLRKEFDDIVSSMRIE